MEGGRDVEERDGGGGDEDKAGRGELNWGPTVCREVGVMQEAHRFAFFIVLRPPMLKVPQCVYRVVGPVHVL